MKMFNKQQYRAHISEDCFWDLGRRNRSGMIMTLEAEASITLSETMNRPQQFMSPSWKNTAH